MDIKLDSNIAATEGGILAALWRKILKDSGFYNMLGMMVSRYVSDTDSMADKVKASRRKTKSTLISNICSSDMTWKVLLDLIFNFLHVKKITISIKLLHQNGIETVHSVVAENNFENGKEKTDGQSDSSG